MKTICCPTEIKGYDGRNVSIIDDRESTPIRKDLSFVEIIDLCLSVVPGKYITLEDCAVFPDIYNKIQDAKNSNPDKDGNQYLMLEDKEYRLVKSKMELTVAFLFGWNGKMLNEMLKPIPDNPKKLAHKE